MRRYLAAGLLAVLSLTACGGGDSGGPSGPAGSPGSGATNRSYDVSAIQKADEIAAMRASSSVFLSATGAVHRRC